jgi:hypothetical protein
MIDRLIAMPAPTQESRRAIVDLPQLARPPAQQHKVPQVLASVKMWMDRMQINQDREFADKFSQGRLWDDAADATQWTCSPGLNSLQPYRDPDVSQRDLMAVGRYFKLKNRRRYHRTFDGHKPVARSDEASNCARSRNP